MPAPPSRHHVFVTGGTGFIGRRLIAELLRRGHSVRALVRSGSEKKLPPGCTAIIGDALEPASYAAQIAPADTFVQLVGVTHPNPSKAAEFRAVDLASAKGAFAAASQARVGHFIYVSVAQPAPVMQAYVSIRAECEEALRNSGLHATILRPWYVLGPGRWWPYLLLPMYWAMALIPATRESARRPGLLTIDQMVAALVAAVEDPPPTVRILAVPDIRQAAQSRR